MFRIPPPGGGGKIIKGFGEREGKGRRKKEKNRSPKGNMWSAIPVALLGVIMNWSEGKQGSGPEGDEVL